MTGQQLRNSILQEAIQGRLVPNVLQPGEKTGAELLQDILAERQKKENYEKGKKAKKLTLSIIEEEPWELPEGWCWCKIEDIGIWGAGATPQRDNTAYYQDGSIPWLKTGELNNGIVYDTEEKVTELALEKCSLRLCQPNDVLIAMYGATIGKLAIAGVPLTTNQACCACTPHKGIYNYYLFYFLLAKKDDFIKQAFGGAQPNISKEKIVSTDFPLPPLSIQKAIVAKIEELLPLVDEYDKAAGELKALNETLPDKLRKSVLQEAIHGNLVPNDIPEGEATAPELLQQILKERQDRDNKEKGKKAKKLSLSTIDEEPWELPEGWCWCALGDICSIIGGYAFKSQDLKGSAGIRVIRISDVTEDGLSNARLVRYTGKESLEQYKILIGDILMAMTGGTVGKSLLIKSIPEPLLLNQRVAAIRNEYINVKYIDIVLKSHLTKSTIEEAKNSTNDNISMSDICGFMVPLPPLSIQHRIVEKIEELFSAINTL